MFNAIDKKRCTVKNGWNAWNAWNGSNGSSRSNGTHGTDGTGSFGRFGWLNDGDDSLKLISIRLVWLVRLSSLISIERNDCIDLSDVEEFIVTSKSSDKRCWNGCNGCNERALCDNRASAASIESVGLVATRRTKQLRNLYLVIIRCLKRETKSLKINAIFKI